MAAAYGRESAGLSERLLHEPHRFGFFQAVRLLERLARECAGGAPNRRRQPVGHDHAPESEVARFRAHAALSFPTSAVSRISGLSAGANGPPPEMVVSFLGMTGPQGVLPPHYTTLLLRRVRDRDYALRDFLDLFNHRAVSLFYRAWEKYRLPQSYERARLDGDEDLGTWGLYCLAGFGTAGLRGRLALDDEIFLFYSGHLAHYPRSAAALEAMLEDYFAAPVRVEQARGQWLTLDEGDRTLLPGGDDEPGLHCSLGVDLIVGERAWDVQGKFRVQVGPMGYAAFQRFLPAGDALRAVCQLARAYIGPELDFDVQPVLRAKEVPPCRLSAEEPQSQCLGWDSWVGNDVPATDAADAVFEAEDGPLHRTSGQAGRLEESQSRS
jgi:type VI secretion system protein ImpH